METLLKHVCATSTGSSPGTSSSVIWNPWVRWPSLPWRCWTNGPASTCWRSTCWVPVWLCSHWLAGWWGHCSICLRSSRLLQSHQQRWSGKDSKGGTLNWLILQFWTCRSHRCWRWLPCICLRDRGAQQTVYMLLKGNASSSHRRTPDNNGGDINHPYIYCPVLLLWLDIYVDLITGGKLWCVGCWGKCRKLESLAAGQQIKEKKKENVWCKSLFNDSIILHFAQYRHDTTQDNNVEVKICQLWSRWRMRLGISLSIFWQ